MKFSYKLSSAFFFSLYIIPVVVLGFLVQNRIQERQTTLQLYLQNQVDVDRQIVVHRGPLRDVHIPVRNYLLRGGSAEEAKRVLALAREEQQVQNTFWQKYESVYVAAERTFLREILEESQESNLISEEERVVREIRLAIDQYFVSLKSYPALAGGGGNIQGHQDHMAFFEELDEGRNAIFEKINELMDIRYIFAQRVVFFVTGENDRQQGFFNTIFVGLGGFILIVTLLEYFYIHRPFGDIMSFLKDMNQGKRGQRLYFSSPIREIKESEEIINEFVNKAETHEKER
ncbi:MAG: hypothetical protein Q7R73_00085 [bacterium]|nr:hypothetical protein [bacterium]